MAIGYLKILISLFRVNQIRRIAADGEGDAPVQIGSGSVTGMV